MKLRLLLKVFAALVVLAVGGVIAFLLTLDVNQYKSRLTDVVEAETGRKLDLRGPLELKIFPRPALVVKDAGFSNASWGTRPEMARLGELSAEVELLPLLRGGNVVITLIDIRDLDLLLETDGKGNANWAIEGKQQKPSPASPPPSTSAEPKGAVSIPKLEKVRLRNVLLTYLDGASKQSTRFEIKTLTAETGRNERVAIDGEAVFREETIKLNATVGDMATLLAPKANFPIAGNLSAASARLKFGGHIADLAANPKLDLQIEAGIDDLAKLNRLLGADLPAGRKLLLTTRISGEIDREISLGALQAEFGGARVTGDLLLRTIGARPAISGSLAAETIDLAELLPKPAARPQAPRRGAGGQQRLFSDDPLPLQFLALFDGDLRLTVGEFKAPDLHLSKIETHLILQDRQLDVPKLSLNGYDGRLDGVLAVNARGALPQLSLELSGRQIDVGKLLKDVADKDLIESKADLNLNLRGQGRSLRAIMASLDGRSELILGPGKIRSKYVDLVGAEIWNQVLPWASRDESRLNCFVSRFDIARGVASSRGLVADTERASVYGEGQVNLGSEQLNMLVTPKPKDPAAVSLATSITLTGWLGDPTIRPDPAGVVKGVAGLVGGAALKPLNMLLPGVLPAGQQNPCLAFLGGAGRPSAQTPPSQQPTTQQRPPAQSGTQNPLRELGDGIKGLFGGSRR